MNPTKKVKPKPIILKYIYLFILFTLQSKEFKDILHLYNKQYI